MDDRYLSIAGSIRNLYVWIEFSKSLNNAANDTNIFINMNVSNIHITSAIRIFNSSAISFHRSFYSSAMKLMKKIPTIQQFNTNNSFFPNRYCHIRFVWNVLHIILEQYTLIEKFEE